MANQIYRGTKQRDTQFLPATTALLPGTVVSITAGKFAFATTAKGRLFALDARQKDGDVTVAYEVDETAGAYEIMAEDELQLLAVTANYTDQQELSVNAANGYLKAAGAGEVVVAFADGAQNLTADGFLQVVAADKYTKQELVQMKANKVLTANGQSNIKLTPYTKAQQDMINNHMQRWNANEMRLAETFGVDSDWNPQAFAGNAATVTKDAWGQWAAEGIDIRRSNLGVAEDLLGAVSRSVDIGVLVDHFAQYSDVDSAVNVSLDGRSDGKSDVPTITYQGTPIAVMDNVMRYGWRQMATLMRGTGGNLLRDSGMRSRNRKILERLEDTVLNGLTDNKGNLINVGGAEAYGLLNHPQRNTQVHGIAIQSSTSTQIKGAVIATLKAAHADNFKYGFTLYMNWDDYFYMQSYQDGMSTAEGAPTATGAERRTIAQEILNIPGVERIVATDSVPVDTIIALVRDRECVEMLNAMPLTQRAKFRANPEDDYVFQNMVAQSIQLKFDADGRMGLAVGTRT